MTPRFCSECGKALENNPKFCTGCGKSAITLSEAQIDIQTATGSKGLSTGAKITLSISALFLGFLFLSFLTEERQVVVEPDSGYSQAVGFEFELKDSWSFCIESYQGNVQCSIWGLWGNQGDGPLEVRGYVYLKAGNKTYKAIAPQAENEIQYATFTLNPGDRNKGGASFDVPNGTYIEKLFIGPNSEFEDAEFVLEINRLATKSGLTR